MLDTDPMPETTPLVNLSFYRFFRMEENGGYPALQLLRKRLRELCASWELRGTLLISHEGVNAMVSGTREGVENLRRLAETEWSVDRFKYGDIEEHSYRRMLVKIKKEIIAVGDPAIRPHERTAPRISAQELKTWLDEKRDVLLVDTRNDYEIELGTFRGAENLGIQTSRDFAAKAGAIDWNQRAQGRPIVTFCTGGIRCEKASALLLNQGVENVYQLDGGILRYLEETALNHLGQRQDHYEGSCFVFDWRLAVDEKLAPTARSEDPSQTFGRHR